MKFENERFVTCPYCGYTWAVIRQESVLYADHKPHKIFGFRCSACHMHGEHEAKTINQVYKQVSLQEMENNRDKILKKCLKGER